MKREIESHNPQDSRFSEVDSSSFRNRPCTKGDLLRFLRPFLRIECQFAKPDPWYALKAPCFAFASVNARSRAGAELSNKN